MTFPNLVRFSGASLAYAVSMTVAATAMAYPLGFDMIYFSSGVGPGATGMAWAPDGSNTLFVTFQDGTVQVFEHAGPWQTRNTWRFATIAPTFENAESGLVGIAFDPAFGTNHYVYFLVTVSASEQQIVRYTAADGVGTNKTVVVSGLPTVGIGHNGGALQFGPDGLLYFGIGDNGEWVGADDDLTSLASKVGRVYADGTVPNDNPFFDGPGPNADLIWARGFRNPFSMTMQPSTGSLWVDAVGERHEQIFPLQRGGHAGWGQYENDQPVGYLTPILSYPAGTSQPVLIADGGAVRATGLVTFTTVAAHGLHKGELVTIAGVSDPSFDASTYVTGTSGPNVFTVASPGVDAASGGGTVTKEKWGACVIGGTFYDATQFPVEYRGNYLFADFVSGAILRTQFAAAQDVASVDRFWVSGGGQIVDLEVGPDGLLYVLFRTGEIIAFRSDVATQRLVLSNQHVWVAQDSWRAVSVSLGTAPSSDVVVSASRLVGDPSIDVEPSVLTFTPSDWALPQPLKIRVASTPANALTTAYIELSAPGLASEGVAVWGIGRAANSLVLSENSPVVVEGSSGRFSVALARAPVGSVAVDVVVSFGDANLALTGPSTLVFTPGDYSVPQAITFDSVDDPAPGDLEARLVLTTTGLDAREVTVRILDDEPMAPRITSHPSTAAGAGLEYTYTVVSTARPSATYSLDQGPVGMSIEPTTGLVTWIPTAQASREFVTVRASNGVAPDAVQSFRVEQGGFACGLVEPWQDAVLSGSVGVTGLVFTEGSSAKTIETQFLIDGATAYVDVGPRVDPQLGGAPAGWDTTTVSNGLHTIEIRSINEVGQTCQSSITVSVTNLGASDAGTDAGKDLTPDGGVDGSTNGSAEGEADATVAPGVDGGFRPQADAATDAGAVVTDSGLHPWADAASDAGAADADSGLHPWAGAASDAGAAGADDASITRARRQPAPGCGCRLTPASSASLREAWMLVLVGAWQVARRRRASRGRHA